MLGTDWSLRLALALSLCGILVAASAASAADPYPQARDPGLASTRVTTELAHPDWYLYDGGLEIQSISAPPACTDAADRLNVSLYNPEGRWMQRLRPVANAYDIPPPAFPARYVVRVGIYDPRCAGLSYAVQRSPAAVGANRTSDTTGPCPGILGQVARARRKLSTAQRYHFLPRYGPKAQLLKMRTDALNAKRTYHC